MWSTPSPHANHHNAAHYPSQQTPFPANFSRTPADRQPGRLNPGNLMDLHNQCRSISPDWLEGIHVGVRRPVSVGTVLLFDGVLSHTMPCGARIGFQYSRPSPGDPHNQLETPFVRFDVDPSTFCMNAGLTLQPLRWLRADWMAQLEPARQPYTKATVNDALRVDVLGSSFTITGHAWNVRRQSGRLALAYLQSVSKHWSLGAEVCTEWSVERKRLEASTALAVRYARDSLSVAATASLNAFDVSFWRQVQPNVQIGTSIVYGGPARPPIGSIVYQCLFNEAMVRGMVDSEWSTGVSYTRHLRHMSCNLGLSMLYCLPTEKFALGLKLDFDATGQQ